jgi:hypothetical protein
MEDKKKCDREVTIDKVTVFRQVNLDLSGNFLGEFANLQV